jgi:hypothetical protein
MHLFPTSLVWGSCFSLSSASLLLPRLVSSPQSIPATSTSCRLLTTVNSSQRKSLSPPMSTQVKSTPNSISQISISHPTQSRYLSLSLLLFPSLSILPSLLASSPRHRQHKTTRNTQVNSSQLSLSPPKSTQVKSTPNSISRSSTSHPTQQIDA